MFHRISLFGFVAFFMLFVAVANAGDYPSCAQPCLGASDPGSCSLTDNACLCQNASFCNATNSCFQSSCSQTDWKAAYDNAVANCNAAGVTHTNVLNPPTKRAVAPEAKRTFAAAHIRNRMHKSRL